VLAEPKNPNAKSLKDFSVTKYNGKYLVYATTADGNWNGFMSTFTSWGEWDDAEQEYIPGLVAPHIFYFEPKDVWVLTYQWGFKYATTTTPDDPSSWSATSPLLNGDPTNGAGTGPIDQTVICDDSDCYIFFADDAGGIYRGSMPIGNFPGAFTATKIMQESTSLIFEGVEVYSVKGSDQYLMIIENNGTRAFRAWTSTDLGGDWTPLAGADSTQSPFAGQANVTWPGGQWTNDISHGDIVRENPSEKMEIDACNLQLLYQGRDPSQNVSYIDLPYRPGLLTLVP
jgi:endo-1,4-beta-xylanase